MGETERDRLVLLRLSLKCGQSVYEWQCARVRIWERDIHVCNHLRWLHTHLRCLYAYFVNINVKDYWCVHFCVCRPVSLWHVENSRREMKTRGRECRRTSTEKVGGSRARGQVRECECDQKERKSETEFDGREGAWMEKNSWRLERKDILLWESE